MTDEDAELVERALARYRPADPPGGLEARIAQTSRPVRSRRGILLSIAASLVAAICLHWLADRAHDDVEHAVVPDESAIAQADPLTATLGGEYARRDTVRTRDHR